MKRALLIFAVLLTQSGGMVRAQARIQNWTCSLDNLADTPSQCIGPAEPGFKRYITDIVAQSDSATAGVFTLYAGPQAVGGTDCNSATSLSILPDGLAIDSQRITAAANTVRASFIPLDTPLVVPGGLLLCVQGDATNAVTVQIFGYVAP